MKLFTLILSSILISLSSFSQGINDTTYAGNTVVIKDYRIEMLGKKMAEYNSRLGINTNGLRSGKGYRLMVISTNDRENAMKLRAQLYQLFPDHKQYMSYQMPNIKIKMGNFVEKSDAERIRKQIISMKLVTNNIYILPETVEIKPDKKEEN